MNPDEVSDYWYEQRVEAALAAYEGRVLFDLQIESELAVISGKRGNRRGMADHD